MSKDPSIPRRNKVNWHYVRDEFMFSTIKLVSRHQNTQHFGALLPIELTNEEIRNSKAYKEYYAIATGEAAPKPKASAKWTRSGFDTSITPPTTIVIPRPTAATTPRLTAAAKGKQTAKASKAKSQSALSSGSGADEGTGSKLEVPDVPTNESEEDFSWNSTDDEGVDDEGKDDDGDEEDERDDDEEGEEDDDDEESENSEDEDDCEEDLDLNIGKEERHDEEEEEDELYRDVNINQGRGLQGTLE
nr:hypothetical protein [Tanacetum cinerariifolium]